MAADSGIDSTGYLVRQRRWSARLRVGLLPQVLRSSVRDTRRALRIRATKAPSVRGPRSKRPPRNGLFRFRASRRSCCYCHLLKAPDRRRRTIPDAFPTEQRM
jgi:hypothetical protein